MIRLGVIGCGGMAHAHMEGFSKIKGVKLTACCDVVPGRADAFAKKWGIAKAYSDFREMLAGEKLDAITNVTIDAAHASVAIAAMAKGLHVLSEKPLASTLAEARAMTAAARKAGVINMVNFSYRNSCGLQTAAAVIREGGIGRIIHVESSYLQSWLVNKAWGDWQSAPSWLWRLSTRHGSAGVLGDIGCHIYDMTTLLCGDIQTIYCRLENFDKGLPGNRLGEYVLDANDSFVSTVMFKNGAMGTVHSSRWATGQMNSLRVRVYGDKGAVEVDLDESYDHYKICRGQKDIDAACWRTVKCRPTPDNFQRFVSAIKSGKQDPSDFANGLKIQAYLHYSIVSDKKALPVKVKC